MATLTDEVVTEIAKAAWDEAIADGGANPAWDELDGATKSRYFDVVKEICTSGGGGSDPFAEKVRELWAAKAQEEDPEPEPEPEPQAEEEEPLLGPGVDLTPNELAKAIRTLDERTGAAPAEAQPAGATAE